LGKRGKGLNREEGNRLNLRAEQIVEFGKRFSTSRGRRKGRSSKTNDKKKMGRTGGGKRGGEAKNSFSKIKSSRSKGTPLSSEGDNRKRGR